jgi:AraC-like DNA-binding protein
MAISLYRKFSAESAALAWPYQAALVELGTGGRYQRADYVEALAVLGGDGRYRLESGNPGGRLQRIRPGLMFFYRPFDVTLIEGNPSNPLSLLFISVPIGDWRIFADFSGIDSAWQTAPEPPMAFFDPDEETALSPLYTALRRFQEGANRLDLFQAMTDIATYFLPIGERPNVRSLAPTWLARSVNSMSLEANLRGGVARLCELAHVSPPYLSRSVRRYYGVTPSELLNDLRLRRAAVLLGTTDESVNSIGARCGFSSPTYFSNRFRRTYSASPREYRSLLSGSSWQRSTIGPREERLS